MTYKTNQSASVNSSSTSMNNTPNTVSQHQYQHISDHTDTEISNSDRQQIQSSVEPFPLDDLMLEMHASQPPMPHYMFGNFALDETTFQMPTPTPPIQETVRGQLLDDGELNRLNGFLETIGRTDDLENFISNKFEYWPNEGEHEPYPPPPTNSRLSNEITHQIQSFMDNTPSPHPQPQHGLSELQRDLNLMRNDSISSPLHVSHLVRFDQPFNGQPNAQALNDFSQSLNVHHPSRIIGGFSQSLDTRAASQSMNTFNSTSNGHASTQEIVVNPFDGSHGLLNTTANGVYSTTGDAQILSTLAWGSDTNFAHSGYTAPLPAINSEQDLQRKVLTMVGVRDSNTTTRANSPAEIKFERIGEDLLHASGTAYTGYNILSPTSSAMQSNNLKRRAEDEESHDQQASRRSRTRKESSEPASTTAPRRRGGKRDQLTEAEKRANHIMSEQKRRNQIKNGFDKLTEIVPELRTGGYSKSAVLTHTAIFVENLVGGNERLKKIVQDLEQRQGLSMSTLPSAYEPLS